MKWTLDRPALSAVALWAWLVTGSPASADTFLVDVSGDENVLYTDPHTGKQIRTGGFSGLHPVPGDDTGTLFYVVTDRGPGGDFGDGKFFAVPDSSPSILTVALEEGGTAQIIDVIPLRKPGGAPVTGIPNPCVPHEEPLVNMYGEDISGLRDPDSLDPEGITVDRAGNFWICEEFRPSICMVAPDGTVVLRLVPEGTLCGGEVIPTFDILPGVYSKRVTNKGFEGIEVARNGKLYVMMQRPLANPDESTSDNSRNLRFLQINLKKLLGGHRKSAIRQYLYVTEVTSKQKSTYISSLASVTPDVFIGAERKTNKVYMFNIENATDITDLEDAGGRLLADPTLTIEQLTPDDLAAMGIVTAAKTVIVDDMEALDPSLEKAEGIAVVGNTLFLTADNDFNIDEENMDWTPLPDEPGILALQDPPNLPRIVTTSLPDFVFCDDNN